MIRVSIILTCYKQEKFIEETILSVVNQKYQNRELLIGDDSPYDNCRKIISKYTKKYPDKIHAWHHNPNKGIVNNMQFLLEHRNKESEYVAFLEGDDCLFPEYLEKKLEVFKNHPDVQLVYNELTTIDDNSEIISEKELKCSGIKICKKGKISYEKLIDKFYYKSWSSLMVRTKVFKNYNFFCEVLGNKTLTSDVYFFNLIAHNEDIYGIEDPLVYYRRYDGSISANAYSNINIYFEIIKYVNYLFGQGFISEDVYKDQICKNYLFVSVVAVKEFLGMKIFRAIKVFSIECVKAVKNRVKRLIK